MSTTRLGAFAIERVVDVERPYALAREFFPDLTPEMLATCQAELAPGQLTADGRLEMSFHSFVIKTGRHVIVVDTCCGNHKQRPLRPAFHEMDTGYLGALVRAGVKPEEVDYVMCTHLHWDHVGWNTRLVDGQWRPTFPNAKYIMSKTEFDHWDQAYRSGVRDTHAQAFEDSVDPIVRAKQAVLVDNDYELDHGIALESCPGHSVGNCVINISSQGQHGVMTGDVLHHQIQLRYPEMSTIADEDRLLARKNRTALIEKHAGSGHLIFPAHFPSPSVGRIEVNQTGGFRFDTNDC